MISIVIPVHNTDKYLRECLESVAAQTHAHYEVIVVDDGSTDRSAKICDEFAVDKRFTVLHTPNRGVSAARNLGVETARGEYIAFVDSDDIVSPLYLEIMAMAMQSTGATAAMCRYTTKSAEAMTEKGHVHAITARQAIERTLYQRGCDSSLCNKLLPREALLKAPQREGMRFEDLEAICRIYEHIGGNIACTTAKPYYYRQHPSSFINTFSSERLDVLQVTRGIEERYAGEPRLLRAARDRRFAACCNIYRLCRGKADEGVPEITAALDECRRVIRTYRLPTLLNRHVRLKNRLGAVWAYFIR